MGNKHRQYGVRNPKRPPSSSKSPRHYGAENTPSPHHQQSIVANSLDIIPQSTRKALASFQKELALHNIERALVVGGIATVFYGRPRFSKDLDFAIGIKEEADAKSLLSIIKNSTRYRVIYPDREANKDEIELSSPEDFGKINLVKLRDTEADVIIDVLLVKDQEPIYGLNTQSFQRSKQMIIDGTEFSIPSTEDFILMKLVSRRPSTEDFQDMFTALSKNYADLDWGYLSKRARDLKVDHLLGSYRKLVEEQEKRRSS